MFVSTFRKEINIFLDNKKKINQFISGIFIVDISTYNKHTMLKTLNKNGNIVFLNFQRDPGYQRFGEIVFKTLETTLCNLFTSNI